MFPNTASSSPQSRRRALCRPGRPNPPPTPTKIPGASPMTNSRRSKTWVKQGMAKGDPAKTPALPKFTDGWQLGTPDLVVKMDKGFTVPAEGADIYSYQRIPLNLPEDKWVQAIELRPSARKVVHHVLYFADSA